MIKFVDFTYSDNKFFMIVYASQLGLYVGLEVDRHSDIPRTIEYYKDIENINKYLNNKVTMIK